MQDYLVRPFEKTKSIRRRKEGERREKGKRQEKETAAEAVAVEEEEADLKEITLEIDTAMFYAS